FGYDYRPRFSTLPNSKKTFDFALDLNFPFFFDVHLKVLGKDVMSTGNRPFITFNEYVNLQLKGDPLQMEQPPVTLTTHLPLQNQQWTTLSNVNFGLFNNHKFSIKVRQVPRANDGKSYYHLKLNSKI